MPHLAAPVRGRGSDHGAPRVDKQVDKTRGGVRPARKAYSRPDRHGFPGAPVEPPLARRPCASGRPNAPALAAAPRDPCVRPPSAHPSMPRIATALVCGAGNSGIAATCALFFKVFSEKIVNLAFLLCRCRLDYAVDIKPSSSVVPVVLFHNLMA